jgi:hypothetical protein
LTRNQDNVSKWSDMLFQWASTISLKIKAESSTAPFK